MAPVSVTAIASDIRESIAVKEALLADPDLLQRVARAVDHLVDAYRAGNKALLAGNGGSAADAQHLAGELVSRFYVDRPGLPALALTTDTSVLTAIGNDYGYERLFVRQLEANARPGDVFIGLSTSGNSANVLAALDRCSDIGVTRIGLTGASGGRMAERCDVCIRVPSTSTPRIQEAHILLGHILCRHIEAALFPDH